ncbi:hypothetical protein F3P66_24385 (plasmid) [Agrobacterium fabrum]|uniref:Uncharacterized protein n=1 Tax=Agrobacterium fabrum (strain C58 / ATCC 33970) TaxID=176299 RepID=Q8UJJ1_AGRFC|nr:hypothetical protein Atu5486 [Agrobacterium fabrum str. C58]QRM62541.1 hypothetical protein F3P66_24385 [Agrobacterium fabrum]TRB28305.1 hypothetical protein EXN51_16905 [Agrobacterium fabrum]
MRVPVTNHNARSMRFQLLSPNLIEISTRDDCIRKTIAPRRVPSRAGWAPTIEGLDLKFSPLRHRLWRSRRHDRTWKTVRICEFLIFPSCHRGGFCFSTGTYPGRVWTMHLRRPT